MTDPNLPPSAAPRAAAVPARGPLPRLARRHGQVAAARAPAGAGDLGPLCRADAGRHAVRHAPAGGPASCAPRRLLLQLARSA
ncbi:MAG: hypothetical protein MZW92_71570 [Comamonadaceae bacterium]|nr:hypothetical protein [Comamonadaceae bacterium]